VFAAPFTTSAAAAVAGFAPLTPERVTQALARLAEDNLIAVVAQPGGTRYRMLETIRQYGAERMDPVVEDPDVRGRHLGWCLATATGLQDGTATDVEFDQVADDLRAGLGWAATQPTCRADAHGLAVRLAELTFARGMSSETQRRYEEAAMLAADAAESARALHLAATVAYGRHDGDAGIRLYRAASEAARRAGDTRRAAVELATVAEVIERAQGILSELPPPGAVAEVLAEARALAGGDDAYVEATALLTAVCDDVLDPVSAELAERAVELSRRAGDARLESAALDQLTAVQLGRGELETAADTVHRRIELLAPWARDVELAWEYPDTLHMASMVYAAAGDLAAARRCAQQRSAIPFFREAAHLAVPWLLTTAALAGDFDEALAVAERFRRAWIEAGRPTIGGLAFAPAAAAMVHGVRGDDEARLEWLDILTEMRRATALEVGRSWGYSEFLDALVALHRGEVDDAADRLADGPDSLRRWDNATWRQWYAAIWAEAGVLADRPDRHAQLERARVICARNPVASAIVDRAQALESGDNERLLASATALDAAGCRYQRARSLVLAGGDAAPVGQAILSEIGATPMARS
jgi:hypothetical protein